MALGCTEPIAIAYASAKARQLLDAQPQTCVVKCSGNIIKNVKSVIVPNTDGCRGIEAAAAIGILAGDPGKKLEVLSQVKDEQKKALPAYLADTAFEVRPAENGLVLDLKVQVFAGDSQAAVRIANAHTNIVSIEKDGQPIRGIYERNDGKLRELEGLEQGKGWFPLEGRPTPESTVTEIVENGIRYRVDFENGQKTGFFLDQKYNRTAAAKIAPGRRVLDCFTHTGSFGLNCKKAGAAQVVSVDVSDTAIAQAKENAALNGLSVEYQTANVFDLLPTLTPGQFDYIILDPPAFTKSGKTVDSAQRGYKEINYRAMKALPRGGYLATCSCSHFMTDALFRKMLHAAARDAQVELRLVEARAQAPDHPVLWTVPETDYLKFYIFQVV